MQSDTYSNYEKIKLTNNIALQIWCLHTPPPKITIPAFLDLTERSLSFLISATKSITKQYKLDV